MKLFLDTNILVYSLSPLSIFYLAVVKTLDRLGKAGAIFYIAPQTIYEFWVVATRPVVNGGLGYSPSVTRRAIRYFIEKYNLLDDNFATMDDALDLAEAEGVTGRRIHDARLVAVMRAHGIRNVLSFDSDMDGFSGIQRHVPTA
jgi:predicted nucleic acid-binding protein